MSHEKTGVRIGLEIHQELSGKKLFCNCSTDMKEENKLFEIKRKLRAVVGESGKVDAAVAYESRRDRTFIYQGYENEACLVDTDSEPPLNINKNALETALAVAKIFKLKIPDLLCVMRKNISDGSACSSFQRTLIVGIKNKNSFIKTSEGNVQISSLCLEEDACKIKKTEGKFAYYSLSRQGIPLLEIVTEPDIKSPEHAKETAQKIGLILRSFPNVKRGIGTIRQDVNVSVQNRNKVEIKGFQDLRSMPKIIENEIERQLGLIKKGEDIPKEVRKAMPDNSTKFLRPMPGAARMYPDTDVQFIPITKQILEKIELPEILTEKVIRFEKAYKLPPEFAYQLAKKDAGFFEGLIKKFKRVEPKFIAQIILNTPKEIKKRYGINPELIKEEYIEEVLSYLNQNKIPKSAIVDVLLSLIKGEEPNLESYKTPEKSDLEKQIKDIIQKNKGASFNAMMGEIMKFFKGKIDGKTASELLKKNYKS